MRWMNRFAFAMMSAALPLVATAGGLDAARKSVEMSMLVHGEITVDTQGKVIASSLNEEAKLPPGVIKLVRDNVPQWRFEPIRVEGTPVGVKSRMNVLVVAKKLDSGDYSVEIRNASFQPAQDPPSEATITGKRMAPPQYPKESLMSGATGVVYLVARVGHDGHVEDTVVEQVNMTVLARLDELQRWSEDLAKAAVRASRRWTFDVPTVGEAANAPYWLVRVPVDFRFHGDSRTEYGKWRAYIPGPRNAVPWRDPSEPADLAPDALPPGGVYMVGRQGMRLLTPLGQG